MAQLNNLKVVRYIFRRPVNVFIKDGVRYILVYEVRALNSLGHKVFVDCYLNLKDAENRVKIINTDFRHIYGVAYIFELKVLF